MDALAALRSLHVGPLAAALLVMYALVVGGAIGSFLNVVAYRLPLGMSLSYPGSRCPRCKKPIRWYHNVPVFGWLMLRGRCHDCSLAISPRYPLVELLVALAAGVTAVSALHRDADEFGTVYIVNAVGLGLRLGVAFVLFGCALLEFDGSRLPARWLAALGVFGMGALLLIPTLRPAYAPEPAGPALGGYEFSLLTAALLALLLWPGFAARATATVGDAFARASLLLITSLVLGGEGLAVVALGASLLFAVTAWTARFWPPAGRLGWAAALLGAMLGWIGLTGAVIDAHAAGAWSSGFLTYDLYAQDLVRDRWQLLVLCAAAVAVLTLIGRAAELLPSRAITVPTSK